MKKNKLEVEIAYGCEECGATGMYRGKVNSQGELFGKIVRDHQNNQSYCRADFENSQLFLIEDCSGNFGFLNSNREYKPRISRTDGILAQILGQ